LAEEIHRFEALTRVLPRGCWIETAQEEGEGGWEMTDQELHFAEALDLGTGVSRRPSGLNGRNAEVGAEEIAARAELASRIRDAGEPDLAAVELGKILILDADQLAVRMTRAICSIEGQRFEAARRDIDAVLSHPGLADYLRKDPAFIRRFHLATYKYLMGGKLEEARSLAQAALRLVVALKQPLAESHFNLARAFAVSAIRDRQYIAKTVEQLAWSFQAHEDYRRYYAENEIFDPLRPQIDAVVERKVEEYRALRGRPLARAN
jgi:hypothetical protein